MSLVTIPDEYDFSTEFPTWIIAYCPDTDSWFCTNKRYFYYEFPDEFQCENDAINYFKNHIPKFVELERELYPKSNADVFLENTGEVWSGDFDFSHAVKLKDLRLGGVNRARSRK